MNIITNWLLSGVAIIISAYVLPGVSVNGFMTALVLAVVLGAINAILKPFLLFITLPINIITLGLFTFVINAFLIKLAGAIVPGFAVDSFWWAMLFAITLSIVSWVIGRFDKKPVAQEQM